MSGKKKQVFTWNEFQKRYKTYDSTTGWSKRCSADYNRVKKDPYLLPNFFENFQRQMQSKKKKARVKAFSTFFAINSSKNNKPFVVKEPARPIRNSQVPDLISKLCKTQPRLSSGTPSTTKLAVKGFTKVSRKSHRRTAQTEKEQIILKSTEKITLHKKKLVHCSNKKNNKCPSSTDPGCFCKKD